MQVNFLSKQQVSLLIANIFIHFDNALYSYLAPLIAPLFFPNKDLTTQLIWGYAPFMIAFLTKPFGLLFFSRMAERTKETIVLRYTLLGLGISLMVMGAVPLYHEGTVWNIALLLLARMCAEACASGEHNIAKMYLIEGVSIQSAKNLAGFYEISTMVGIVCAGGTATWLAWIDNPHLYWRFPFLIAGLATLCNVFFRFNINNCPLDHQTVYQSPSIYLQLWQARKPIIRIAIVAGFSYLTYAIVFVFINSFIPMVTTINYATMVQYLPMFMLLDIALIGWITKVAQKADHNNIMAVAAGLVGLSIIPIFSQLPNASILYVTISRCWLIFLGVAFSSFVTVWSKEQMMIKKCYVTIGFATVLGGSLFGKSSIAICFYLFDKYNSAIAPACYIAFLAFLATLITADSASE